MKQPKRIFFNNASNSTQDIQEVKDQLFEAVFNGERFVFVSSDGDGDNWSNDYECLGTDHDAVPDLFETLGLALKPDPNFL